jgi:RNA methyltransferase, TrmH family
VESITSRQNAVVKRFRALARTAPVRVGEALLDGEHLVGEALASRISIDVAAFSQRRINASPELSDLARTVAATGARVVTASDDVFAAMTPVRQPSGVVAIGRIQPTALGSAFERRGREPLVLVLAGVQDPGNVGAIIRSAAAFDATAVVTTEGSANPFGWKALRGAMGGTFRVPVTPSAALQDVIAAARDAEVPLVAAVPNGVTALHDARLDTACAIVVGAEGAGLPEFLIAAARDQIRIPMRAPVESLNVAIAAALLLYEASRQRPERP